MSSAGKVVFLVQSAEPDRLLRMGLWALTAASVGESVDVLLTAAPLTRWAHGMGVEEGRPDLGLPGPRGLLSQAKELAPVRVCTCDTELKLAGISLETVEGRIDEVVSLPSFWRENRTSRLVSV